MTNRATRVLVIAVLLISIGGVVHDSLEPTSAQAAFDFSISLNGYSLSVAPNHSGYVQVTVPLLSGSTQNVTLSSVVSPQDGQLSASFAQISGYPPFVTTLIVSALAASPGKQYAVTVSGTAQGLTKQAPVLTVTITCSQSTCPTLTTTVVGDGTVDPSCPSGCLQPVGQTVNVTATPAASWTFSGWNITGAACSATANSVPNPCVFTMPNDSVSVTADFIQYQTLFTSYTGYGQLSPSCPTGCQIAVGSSVSIVATPAPGWVVSGYHLTSGVSCRSQPGYICSLTMPNFPVTFVVAFTESTTPTQSTVTVSSTIQTSVTSTTVIGGTITSTTTTSTLSVTQTGGTQTATLYSTSSVTNTQTQSNLLTQFWTLSTSETSVTTTLADPPLEVALAGTILFSMIVIGINMLRRSPRGGSIVCARCGFKNSSSAKFCVGCGESLKRP